MAKSTLTPELLRQPVRRAARSLARLHLLKVLEEAARLEVDVLPGTSPEADDSEAVHDFRVALRRLRSWLQAFRPFLGDTRRSERAMRRLSRVAGVARDLQVQRGTLCEMGNGGTTAALDARRIELQISRDAAQARRRVTRAIIDGLPQAAAGLAAGLHAGEVITDPTMSVAMARLLAERQEQVETSLSRLKRTGQVNAAHRARIAVKRLRYLLESFGRSSRLAAGAVRRLTGVQDELGKLHDTQLLLDRIADRAKPALRVRLRRDIRTGLRRARRLSRSHDITSARQVTTRLIRRLDPRS